MAEYDLTPLVVEDDLQGTYDLLKQYFLRENNPFNVLTDYVNEDGFTIDIVRSYSFISSEYRATVHLAGFPQDDGTTKVTFHAKSVDTAENLEIEIRNRIAETLKHMLAAKKNRPVDEEPIDEDAVKKRNRIELIVIFVIVAIIVVGTLPISCSEQFSQFWIV